MFLYIRIGIREVDFARLRPHIGKGVSSRAISKEYVVTCSICREELESKAALLNQPGRVHGTISRRPLSALDPS
jgi:hypothetical protein